MFNKTKRVTRKEFDEVLKNGKVLHGDSIYMRYLNHDDRKFSTVVPKKVLNKAFARNRLKRRINSLLKDVEDKFKNGKYIFFAKKGCEEKTNEEILKDLLNFTQQ